MGKNILLVDDEINILKVISAILKKDGNMVECFTNPIEALQILSQKNFDLLITDLKMPEMDGIQLLKIVHEKYSDMAVIIMTAHGTVETAVEAMKIGACDYILKPFEMEEIRLRVNLALNGVKYKQKEIKLPADIKSKDYFNKLIGVSSPMQEVLSIMNRVACTDSTILIMGESGTGKELIARGIHNISPSNKEPFIAINCAAIPENLLESELFGHEKGSFTGAVDRRKGRFELVGQGTLFLDEIGDMSPSTQVKLLRVLQEKTFERIGSNEQILFQARIICATNKNLDLAIKEGRFREDLYYRINVIPVNIPPLRDRKEDIEILTEYFLNYFCQKFKKKMPKINDLLKEAFLNYDWPGNIRELENIIEYLLVLKDKEELDINDLPKKIKKSVIDNTQDEKSILKNSSKEIEKEIILKYLVRFKYNRTKTAEALGINRRTLLNKINEYNLEVK